MERFDVQSLRRYSPFVLLMVGNRRQGKSYLNNYLCQELSGDFDLIISFMGSKHCNPELHNFLESVGLDDFQFDCWDSALMTRLEHQQQELMRQGRVRRVLILVDDITLEHNDREKLAHLCIRGRHFHVSVSMLSVSYSNFHKSCRRSLDFIFLFSLGCATDRKLMMEEFAHKKHTCQFYMDQITQKDHTCAVLDLNEKQQKVYWFKAPPTGARSAVRPPRTLPQPHKNRTPDSCGGSVGQDPLLGPGRTGRSSGLPGPVSCGGC